MNDTSSSDQADYSSQHEKPENPSTGLSRMDKTQFLPLSVHYPKISAFSSFISWGVVFVILLAIDLLIPKIDLHFLVLPAIAFFAIASAIYGYYFAKSCGYYNGDFDILYKQGLWWKKQTALSFSRIQHIDISHGPLERRYKMATIKFFTAGGVASDLKIPGLPKELAESIRTEILQYAKNELISDPQLEKSEILTETSSTLPPEQSTVESERNNE